MGACAPQTWQHPSTVCDRGRCVTSTPSPTDAGPTHRVWLRGSSSVTRPFSPCGASAHRSGPMCRRSMCRHIGRQGNRERAVSSGIGCRPVNPPSKSVHSGCRSRTPCGRGGNAVASGVSTISSPAPTRCWRVGTRWHPSKSWRPKWLSWAMSAVASCVGPSRWRAPVSGRRERPVSGCCSSGGVSPNRRSIRTSSRRAASSSPRSISPSSSGVAVEYDGRVHAEDPRQFARDADRWAAIRDAGWDHVRILSHHLRDGGAPAVVMVRSALIRAGWRPGL